ncbi:acyltransferase family protein [Streptomyces sp. NPDC058864]
MTELRTASRQIPRTTEPARAGRAGTGAWRPDIQGLRALVVTLVVLGHAGAPYLAGGYVGVDVFFVISGFLITASLLRGGTLRAFYARRVLRLLPAATLVVAVTLAGAWFFLSKIRSGEYAGDALASALYAVNLRLAATGTDYLSQGAPPSPFQHFWSLAVEEQFYLLWPALLLGRRAARGRRGRVRQAVPLAVLCLLSLGLSVRLTPESPSWAYFGPHTRFWELGTGAVLAFAAGRLRRHLPSRLAGALTWAGLGCVVLAAVRFDAGTAYPGARALLPVLGASLVVAGGCAPDEGAARRLLASRPATWLGGLSYGWYLWHWPMLVIGPAALGLAPSVPSALALGVAALLPAWLTLHLVENPVRFHRALRGHPHRALRLGIGLSAVTAVTALTVTAFPPAVDSGAAAPSLRRALATAPAPEQRLATLLAGADTRLPANLAPPLARIKQVRSAVYRDGCHVDYASTSTPPCAYGDLSSGTVVVLFGDFHAAQWFPALDRLAHEHHWRLVSLTKASCKTAAVTIVNHNRPYTACDRWREKAFARIARLRPALVLVSSSEAGTPARLAADPRRQWTDGFRDTFGRLTATGASVGALLDTPWPELDAVDCTAAHPLRLSRCTRPATEAIRDPARRTAVREAARATGVHVIDPEPWLCVPDGTCPVVVGDTFVYRDDSHLADAYSEALAPVLHTRLAPLLPPTAGG